MNDSTWERKCPQCAVVLRYKHLSSLKVAEKANSSCQKCANPKKFAQVLERNCGQCGKLLHYSTRVNCEAAKKANSMCNSCTMKNSRKGKGNPMFGKKHSDETKLKIRNAARVSAGDANPMYNKTFYSVWLEKYGEEEANRLLIEYKAAKSIRNSGVNNPMYGKPTPQGSGNGWKGHYKEWFFRSLRELSYVISLEQQGKTWRSAEGKEFRTKYTYLGSERTYCPDFIVEEKLLVEVKPKRLHRSLLVRAKAEAAQKLCEERGLEYLLTDAPILSDEQIKELHSTQKIVFTERYEILYQKRIKGLAEASS
jgi:hypothetical protein